MSSSSLISAPGVSASRDLLQLLAGVADPRRGGPRVHPVGYVLAVMVIALTTPGFALLTGAAQLASSWPRGVLLRLGARPDPLTKVVRPPAEATIRRMLTAVDPGALQGVIDAWTAHLRRHHGDGGDGPVAVAIDGKAVRGAKDTAGVMPHLLGAVTHENPMVITQRRVPAKTSEIPAVRAMVADLDLAGIGGTAGVVVTVDALHTHADSAQAVLDAGGHYLMTVKGNQRRLRAAVIHALAAAGTADPVTTHRATARGHGAPSSGPCARRPLPVWTSPAPHRSCGSCATAGT